MNVTHSPYSPLSPELYLWKGKLRPAVLQFFIIEPLHSLKIIEVLLSLQALSINIYYIRNLNGHI